MPRPSATDAVEHPPADLPHRLTTNPINSSDLTNHRPSPSSTTVRLVHPQGLPTIHVESKSSSSQDSMTTETKRSPSHANSIQFPPHSATIKTISTPLVSSRTARPLMEDKGIQCIDDEQSESDNTHPDGNPSVRVFFASLKFSSRLIDKEKTQSTMRWNLDDGSWYVSSTRRSFSPDQTHFPIV